MIMPTMKDQTQRKGPRCHYCRKFGHIQRYCNERVQNEWKLHTTNQHERKYSKHKVYKVEVKQTNSNDSDSDVGLVVGHALSVG